MMDDIAMVGKPFIVLSTNGDLPTNPMRLSECMVCGGVFTRDQSRRTLRRSVPAVAGATVRRRRSL